MSCVCSVACLVFVLWHCTETPPGNQRLYISMILFLSGYALLYLHLHKCLSSGVGRNEGENYLMLALQHLKEALANPQGRRHTFLCGDAGPLALGAVVYSKVGDERNSAQCISRYSKLATLAIWVLHSWTQCEKIADAPKYSEDFLFVRGFHHVRHIHHVSWFTAKLVDCLVKLQP